MTDNDGARGALQAQLATARADALREAAAEASGRQGRSTRDSQFNIGWDLACASIQSDILALIPQEVEGVPDMIVEQGHSIIQDAMWGLMDRNCGSLSPDQICRALHAALDGDAGKALSAMGERPANDDCRYDFEVALKDDNERLRKRLSAMPWLIGC